MLADVLVSDDRYCSVRMLQDKGFFLRFVEIFQNLCSCLKSPQLFFPNLVVKVVHPQVTNRDVHVFLFLAERRIDLSNVSRKQHGC